MENAQRFLQEFENVGFRHDKLVDDFAMRLNSMVAMLRVLGEKLEEARIVKKLVRVVLPELEQAIMSIEMLLDLDKMKVEELVGWLCVAEGKCGEQWEAHQHQRADKEHARNVTGGVTTTR